MTSCVMPATTSLQISANFEDVEFVDGDEVMHFHQDKNPWQSSLRNFDDLGLDVSRRRRSTQYCRYYQYGMVRCVNSRKLYRCQRVMSRQILIAFEWKLIGEGPRCEIKCSAPVRDELLRFIKARHKVCMYHEPASQAKKCCYECKPRLKSIWQLKLPTRFCRKRGKAASRR